MTNLIKSLLFLLILSLLFSCSNVQIGEKVEDINNIDNIKVIEDSSKGNTITTGTFNN